MKTLAQWSDEYSDDQGVGCWWSNYREDGPYWEIGPHFHPLQWELSLRVEREVGSGKTWPNRLYLSATLGPWSVFAIRTWPAPQPPEVTT